MLKGIMARDYSSNAEKGGEIQLEKLLFEAAAVGDYETVRNLLQSGVSVDADEYNKALFYASKNYMTPLQIAAANGYLNCVQILIEYGADVNAKDRFDVTAMHMAAEKGNHLCLKALLDANADCCLPTKFSKSGCYTAVPHLGGTTPLHLAASNNHIDCVKELIQYGADYNAVDERGRTSLYIAAKAGYEECVLAHLKNAVGRDILSLPSLETFDTPLHFAVSRGMVNCVRELLNLGSDVNHVNYAGLSPLHLAVNSTNEITSSSMEILKMLVLDGYNTDINQGDGSDLTPLHYVCFIGRNTVRFRPEMAKFLISYGADVNIKNTRGFSLLECELIHTDEDFTILKYIVKSMLHPPRLRNLRIVPYPPPASGPRLAYLRPLREQDNALEMAYARAVGAIAEVMEGFHAGNEDGRFGYPPPPPRVDAEIHAQWEANCIRRKQMWYESIASNPRTLQHYCRYTIRHTLGPRSLKYIKR
ncbi:Serine/threonine-protein phosphatase 6 regulatory ankyrin repeat subunit B, partial [Stegodyphus mimosarum]